MTNNKIKRLGVRDSPCRSNSVFPGNGARKRVGGSKLTREYLPGNSARNNACTSHVSWEPQEEGMMSAATSFSSV